MWTPTTRWQHSREGLRYETDLMAREWRVIEPYLPAACKKGRPREWRPREVVNAIFYVLRGGIGWRLLPSDFPPWQTVYRWFAAWRDQGVFERINHALVMVDRERVAPLVPFIDKVFADSGYAGERVARATTIAVEIVRKNPDQVGFAVQPRRWVVERFFAWINRNRRLAKDFEATIASARAFLYIASIMLLVRRLGRAE